MSESFDDIETSESTVQGEWDETPYHEQFTQAVEHFVFSPDDGWGVSACETDGRRGAHLDFNGSPFFLVADPTNSIRGAAACWYRDVVRDDPSRARG